MLGETYRIYDCFPLRGDWGFRLASHGKEKQFTPVSRCEGRCGEKKVGEIVDIEVLQSRVIWCCICLACS